MQACHASPCTMRHALLPNSSMHHALPLPPVGASPQIETQTSRQIVSMQHTFRRPPHVTWYESSVRGWLPEGVHPACTLWHRQCTQRAASQAVADLRADQHASIHQPVFAQPVTPTRHVRPRMHSLVPRLLETPSLAPELSYLGVLQVAIGAVPVWRLHSPVHSRSGHVEHRQRVHRQLLTRHGR
eukprot:364242-Chlamydomonas_euryale.AAC.2